jgi:hypothetical protein
MLPPTICNGRSHRHASRACLPPPRCGRYSATTCGAFPMPDAVPLASDIMRLSDEGYSAGEIAELLAIPEGRVRRISARYRIRLQPLGGRVRRIATFLRVQDYATVRAIAHANGSTPVEIVTRLTASLLEAGPQAIGRLPARAPAPETAGGTTASGAIARARSASPRSRERLRTTRSRRCPALATRGDLPAMILIPKQTRRGNHSQHPLATLPKSAW